MTAGEAEERAAAREVFADGQRDALYGFSTGSGGAGLRIGGGYGLTAGGYRASGNDPVTSSAEPVATGAGGYYDDSDARNYTPESLARLDAAVATNNQAYAAEQRAAAQARSAQMASENASEIQRQFNRGVGNSADSYDDMRWLAQRGTPGVGRNPEFADPKARLGQLIAVSNADSGAGYTAGELRAMANEYKAMSPGRDSIYNGLWAKSVQARMVETGAVQRVDIEELAKFGNDYGLHAEAAMPMGAALGTLAGRIGSRPIDIAKTYELEVRGLYGDTPFNKRTTLP